MFANIHWRCWSVITAGGTGSSGASRGWAGDIADPVSVLVDTFGTGTVADTKIEKAVKAVFGLKPAQIIKDLDLLRPIYEPTSAYGHFGRNRQLRTFTWERRDKVDALKAAL